MIDWDSHTSTTSGEEVTRFTVDIGEGKVGKTTFPNTIDSRFINTFDFPTINEDYRGRKYCITYGVTAIAYSRVAVVKKNLCNSDEDKVRDSETRPPKLEFNKVKLGHNHKKVL